MDQQALLKLLDSIGAVITNSHVVYTSGKHGSAYINKDALYPHTTKTSLVCRALAKRFVDDGVEIVIAPAVGGVAITQWMAYHLSEALAREVLALYADKVIVNGQEDFVVKRGYNKLVDGKKVLVAEDILNTGGSVRKVVEAVRRCNGTVVGVGVLGNRGGVTVAELGDVPRLEALVNVTMDTWDPEDCPHCANNIPVRTDVGHGSKFLASKKQAA